MTEQELERRNFIDSSKFNFDEFKNHPSMYGYPVISVNFGLNSIRDEDLDKFKSIVNKYGAGIAS